MVLNVLRDVQGRGLTDFLVVCDDTNNTSEVIDRNEFRADIFNRSINCRFKLRSNKIRRVFSEVAAN